MGTEIRNVVSVNITREAANLARTGFGTGCIIAPVKLWSTRMRTFSAPADLLTAGLLASDPIYLAALSMYRQNPKPETFKVCRKLENVNSKQLVTWNVDATAGTFVLGVSKAGATAELTDPIAYNADAATIKAALEANDNVAEATVTLIGANASKKEGFTIEFTGADGNLDFAITVTSLPTTVTVATVSVSQYGSAVETWAAAYAAAKVADNDFYGVMIASVTAADIQAVAAVVEADTTPRKFFWRTADANTLVVGGTAGIFYIIKALAYVCNVGIYSTDTTNYGEAALMAYALARDPGSYSLKFAQIIGVTPETLTADYLTALNANNANFIETVGGVTLVSSEGKTVGGEYFDVMHFVDWLGTRMSEDVFQRLINAAATIGKTPYTVGGFGMIEGQIRARLQQGEIVGGITPGTSEVTMPHPDDASTADKGTRTVDLTNVFTAQLAGAIHFVDITGNLYL